MWITTDCISIPMHSSLTRTGAPFTLMRPEIKEYFENFANKYELDPYIKLNSRVLGAAWVEDKGIYEVEIDCNGEMVHDYCHVFINATGFLNSWKWPKIMISEAPFYTVQTGTLR